MLAARLGPLGHGPGFGGFFRAWTRVRGIFPLPGEAVLLPFNEKRLGSVHPSGRVFFSSTMMCEKAALVSLLFYSSTVFATPIKRYTATLTSATFSTQGQVLGGLSCWHDSVSEGSQKKAFLVGSCRHAAAFDTLRHRAT